MGPSDVGASLVMGNSPAMWDKVYDKAFKRREMQTAVDAMATWREGTLNNRQTETVAQLMPRVENEEDVDDFEIAL